VDGAFDPEALDTDDDSDDDAALGIDKEESEGECAGAEAFVIDRC